ncbi:MAG: NADH-quinone oxidoreductase subunit N [Polyangiales bacterium]
MNVALSPYIPLIPLLVVGFGAFALMLVDAFTTEKSELAILATVILFSAAVIGAALAAGKGDAHTFPGIEAYLHFDRLTQFLNVTVCLGAGLTALLAGGYLPEHALERGEFYALLLLSTFGAQVLAAASDLLTIFIGLETMSLGVYCMVAFRRGSPRAAEGGIKYFLLGSFAAAILLFGSALLYGATGHTDFTGIGESLRDGHADARLVILGMLMLLTGFFFKVSAVPFHMWTPDAYEGAVTPATTFMSVVVKAAAFAAMLRLLLVCFSDTLLSNLSSGWPGIVVPLAAVTLVYGNFAASQQANVKRMLAYSSIAHAGYLLIGVAALHTTDPGVRQQAVSGVLFYLLAYTVSNALAFGSLIAIGSHGKEAVSYEDLAGVGRRHPLVALPFIVGVLSLMGFPPTAGFLGKWYVFSAAIGAGNLLWLVILGVLTSVIGAYYYLRVIVYMFMRAPEPGSPIAVPMRSGYVVVALAVAGYFVLKMGITPERYIELALAAAGQVG